MKTRTGADRSVTAHWRLATKLVRGGTQRSDFGETSEALFLSSGFAYDSAEIAEARFDKTLEGYTYTRQGNPTVSVFEERMALLEGAQAAAATASGMAAMNAALLGQLEAGDHVVASKALFGSCRWLIDELLPRYGIATTTVDGPSLQAWRDAVRGETTLFFLETPANPTLELIDIAAVADIARSAGAKLVVDNVFATPILQRPLDLGADMVCYSATKHIDGQGRTLGGVILGDEDTVVERLGPFLRHTGPVLSPFNAWVLAKALETLELRVHAMCDRAEAIASALAADGVAARHPCLPDFPQRDLADKQMRRGGSLVTFTLPGGKAEAFAFLNALEIIDISNNLGDARTIATHPWSTTHKAIAEPIRREMGIGEGMIRISAGLEDPADLIEDVRKAVKAAKGRS